jgi:hypothetical protein
VLCTTTLYMHATSNSFTALPSHSILHT